MPNIEVCLTPALMDNFEVTNKTVIVIDVLRATSTFATGLYNGLVSIVPVAEVARAKELAAKGMITAGEREGKKIEGLAHGNSPTEYLDPYFKGKTLAMTTTNGTKCIALSLGAAAIYTVSFNNLDASTLHLASSNSDILILCSGWKDRFNHEDTWCAGAIVNALSATHTPTNDAATAAAMLYDNVKNNLQAAAKNISHYKRLAGNGVNIIDIEWCFTLNNAPVVVKLVDDTLVVV
jgi:2-phosphosulfolactate phosphatase